MRHPERNEQLRRFLESLGGGREVQRWTHPVPPLEAVRRRQGLITSQLLAAYRPDALVGWRTFLVPTELFHATGLVPLTPEISGAALARQQDTVSRVVEKAEECGYNLRQCSFLKTIIGAARLGLMPRPDIVVGSPCFCNGIGSVLHDVSDYYQAPFFYLNLPLHSDSPGAVEHVAGQLRELTQVFCRLSGASFEEVVKKRLPRAIELSRLASGYWKEVEKLRQAVPSPMSGREALDFATVLAQTWGCEEIVEIYWLLRDELRARIEDGVAAVPEEKVRLFWLHLRPYYQSDIMKWIENAGGAVVFEEVNYPARRYVNPEKPFTSLAREILYNAGRYRAFTEPWKEDLRYVAREFKLDGVIHFDHDSCGWSESVFPPMYRFIRDELRLPLLNIDGDCLVKRKDKLQSTRVMSFMENLVQRKMGNGVQAPDSSAAPSNGRLFVGIDVGSVATKVVVLDSSREIKGTNVLPTGSDCRATVHEALEGLFNDNGGLHRDSIEKVVVTGVGRSNVPFEHEEVTELTCHTSGVRHMVPDAGSIIDIGGQDTKAILIREAVCRMNNSCAAGTGKFLEVIASALGIDLAKLAEFDGLASSSEPISKVCTVFAESEVINAIASGADPGMIVRGVHEMVASKAAVLLKQLCGEARQPVVFSGGVALNQGVVRALQECLGVEVLVPDRPQLMGALGAALLAIQGTSK